MVAISLGALNVLVYISLLISIELIVAPGLESGKYEATYNLVCVAVAVAFCLPCLITVFHKKVK